MQDDEVLLLEHARQILFGSNKEQEVIDREQEVIDSVAVMREKTFLRVQDKNTLAILEECYDGSVRISQIHIQLLQGILQEKKAYRDTLQRMLDTQGLK